MSEEKSSVSERQRKRFESDVEHHKTSFKSFLVGAHQARALVVEAFIITQQVSKKQLLSS